MVRHSPVQYRKSPKREKDPVQIAGGIWKVSDPQNGIPWFDAHEHSLRAAIEAPKSQAGYGIKVSRTDMTAAIEIVAHANRFHPLRDRLLGFQWDGIARLDHLFVDYLGCPDDPYHRNAARMMMLGAVARIMEPGHKWDFVAILEGPQGIRKSTFVTVLGLGYKADLTCDLEDTQKVVEQTQGHWIMEIPELQGFSKHDVSTLKAVVGRVDDVVRMPYQRSSQVFKRQCIFIGSTNDKHYLRDATGDRRYWPIRCNVNMIDTEKLSDVIHLYWAEAVQIYSEMRANQPTGILPLYLSDNEAAGTASSLQESRRLESQEEQLAGQIEHWLNQPIGTELGFDELDPNAPQVYRDHTCVREIMIECLRYDARAADSRVPSLIGKAMRLIPGWEAGPRIVLEKWGRQVVYRRVGVC